MQNSDYIKKILFNVFLSSFFSCVSLAADYPPELQGPYASSQGSLVDACKHPAIVIGKAERYNEVDASCKIAKISGSGGKYSMDESCGREDARWSQKTIMELKGQDLRIIESSQYQGKNSAALKKCPFIDHSKPEVNNKNTVDIMAQRCAANEATVFEGAAGKKIILICAIPKKPPFTKIEYRFGTAGKLELNYVADASNNNKFYSTSETYSPRANLTSLWFKIGDTTYVVSQCMGGECPISGGILVVKGKKIIAKVRANEAMFSDVAVNFVKNQSLTPLIQMKDAEGLDVTALYGK